ncbi:type IX secretion system membrane protein PorP/SprF [Sediminibacterium sp. KACHI17]|uniref:Type IX secretion system membrane protein PorP/SprF n=2 Tax=Sediminibacterium sp. KACHI17 TaxID=1751071 RepID=A0AAT9GES4_9BACT
MGSDIEMMFMVTIDMKVMKRCLLIAYLVMVCIIQKVNAQQQIQFSQYVFNPLTVNPAYAGYRGDVYLSAVFRKQWVNIPGAPESGAVSVDGLRLKNNESVGWGFQIATDKLGPQEATNLYANYAYRIQLDHEDTRRFCLGLGFGATQYRIDGSALKFVDDNDQAIPIQSHTRIVPDANFGIFYYTPKSYIGISVMDLLSRYNVDFGYSFNNNRYATMTRSQHIYLNAGTMFTLSDQVKLKPSFMWKEDFKGPSNFDFTVFALLDEKLWLGGSYRTGISIWDKKYLARDLDKRDAFSLIAEIFLTDKLRVGYSYDQMLNGLNNYQNGSHELSIGIRFTKPQGRTISPRYF